MTPSSLDPLEWLSAVLRHDPDRTLLTTAEGRVLTYRQCDRLATHFAAALASKGVTNGDRVVTQAEKSPEMVALYLACLKIGAIFVPLNTAYTPPELDYFIGNAAPRIAVVQPGTQDAVAALESVRGATNGPVHLETLGVSGDGSLLALASSLPVASFDPFSGESNALAALLYTSGTTGRSKGAMLSRGNLASNAATLVEAWQFSSRDVLLHALPIFHVHGLFVAINTVLAAGASMLFMPRFDPVEILKALPHATVMMGVPTFYTRLLQEASLDRDVTRNVRLFISGSAPLLAETHRRFEQRTGHSILERYGMSETLMNTSNPLSGERIPGSVGPALAGIEVRITDPNSAVVLTQPGAVGMIEVRGPNVFGGYWRLPDHSASAFRRDGFFVTGDLGRLDERGYAYIVGRDKDLIITGGYNVYPIEVENEIDALPGVIESAVVGLPHPDFGEGVAAIVVRHPDAPLDEAGIRIALKSRLASFKIPKRVVFATQLPRNPMGKVQKSQLRETYRELLQDG